MSWVVGGPPDCPGPGDLFWAADVRRQQLQQLRRDRSGEARAELIRCVFAAMARHQRVSALLSDTSYPVKLHQADALTVLPLP